MYKQHFIAVHAYNPRGNVKSLRKMINPRAIDTIEERHVFNNYNYSTITMEDGSKFDVEETYDAILAAICELNELIEEENNAK